MAIAACETLLLRTLAARDLCRRRRPPPGGRSPPFWRGAARAAVRRRCCRCRPVALERLPAALLARAEAIGTAAWLADREVGHRTRRRRLSLWPRQRRANQRPMDRPFFAVLIAVVVVHGSTASTSVHARPRGPRRPRVRRFRLRHRPSHQPRRSDRPRPAPAPLRQSGRVPSSARRTRWPLPPSDSSCGTRFGAPAAHLRVERRRRLGLAPLPRNLGVFVFVLGVARRAARLLHVVADHRDDGVVGQPPLARAVIVQNVTKPKLALLHQNLPRILAGGERDCERRAQS